MRHEKRIIEAFEANKIKRVLLIDDAYDPPELGEKMVAALADFLDGENGEAACRMCGIGEDKLNIAKKVALEGDYNSDELKEVNHAIYTEFVKKREDKFDPSGEFSLVKNSALEALLPLHHLLCKCGEKIDVRTVGLENGMKCYYEFRPEVLFVDYYLSSDVPPSPEKVSQHKRTKALRASVDLLKQVINATRDVKDIPAIVLMSSYGIHKTNQYRYKTQLDEIMSLRFEFLKKDWVREENDILIIDHAAADVLLDISQGYLFGKALQLAVAQWESAAESALKNLLQEVGDLNTKDFAYLLRFKLREEGQPLGEYLRWFFGECLKGFIDNKVVDQEHYPFSEIDGENNIDKLIEGAFEGPSRGIAKFFHRVRVDSHHITNHTGYRMGDLYAQSDGQKIVKIRAVITPGCDLVERRGKTNVESVLTIGGMLNTFDKDGSAADDFFLYEDKPYSVLWKPKDLEMFPITGPTSLHETDEFKFLGTLRPLYAQEIQSRALTRLSRVGLQVAPALGINATVKVFIRKNDASNPFQNINIKSSALATIIPSRAGQSGGHRVLLRRSFLNELIDQLNEVDTAEMLDEDVILLKKVLEEKSTEQFYETLLREGGWTKAEGKFGTGFLISDKPKTKQDAPWLQFILKVSNDEMKELQMRYPLDLY